MQFSTISARLRSVSIYLFLLRLYLVFNLFVLKFRMVRITREVSDKYFKVEFFLYQEKIQIEFSKLVELDHCYSLSPFTDHNSVNNYQTELDDIIVFEPECDEMEFDGEIQAEKPQSTFNELLEFEVEVLPQILPNRPSSSQDCLRIINIPYPPSSPPPSTSHQVKESSESGIPKTQKQIHVLFSQRGHPIIFYDGFIYRLHRVYESKITGEKKMYWVCVRHNGYSTDPCKGNMHTLMDQTTIVKFPSEHDHDSMEISLARRMILNNMRHRAQVERHSTPGKIITDILAQNTAIAPSLPSTENCRAMIEYQRKSTFDIPKVEGLDYEYDPEWLKSRGLILIHSWKVRNEDGKVIKRTDIFTTEEMMNNIDWSDLLQLDGTFESCPPPYKQLFTVYGNVKNSKKIVPAFKVLTTGDILNIEKKNPCNMMIIFFI